MENLLEFRSATDDVVEHGDVTVNVMNLLLHPLGALLDPVRGTSEVGLGFCAATSIGTR